MSADEKHVGENGHPSPSKVGEGANGVEPTRDTLGAGNAPGSGEHDSGADEDSQLTEEDVPQVLSPEQTRIRELEAAAATAASQAQDAQARLRAVSKKFTELQAEMKSFRERQETRAKEEGGRQKFSMAKTFFDPVMNLKRTLATAEEADSESPLVSGLRMVNQQFMDALTKLGFEEVPGEGSPFNPLVHEALAVTPVTDESLDGIVLTVHSVGYAVNGQVLQPARVVVGKYQSAEGGEA